MIWILFASISIFLQQDPWLPLEEGRTWVYATSANKELTIRVVKVEKLGDVSCTVLETSFNGKSSREWLGRDEEGVKLYRIQSGIMDVMLKEPVLRIRLPMKPGEEWGAQMDDGGVSRTLHFSVSGPTDVRVGKTTYSCMKVTAKSRSGQRKIVSESWYARGVGIVRQLHSTGRAMLSLELKKMESRSDGGGK